jgi:hypothetical protein
VQNYIVYETTNTINGHKYRGVTCRDWNYLGSGVELKKAIKFFGRDAFYRRTLSVHNTKEEAYASEAVAVDANWVARRDTYNTIVGGGGAHSTDLTQARLKELLDYNPDTGIFTRKVSRPGFRVGDVAGSLTERGYIKIGIDGKNYSAHRLAWLYVHGKSPDNCIDHINGVRDDNRISNLRDVTSQENSSTVLARKNQADAISAGKTGVKGVSVQRQKHKDKIYEYYHAQIMENGKKKSKLFPFTPEGLEQATMWYNTEYERIYGSLNAP